jgi:hypothetical protein
VNAKERRRFIKTRVVQAVELSQLDVHELVDLLEITVDDVLKNFSHKLIDHAEKFGVETEEEEEGVWWQKAVDED